MPMWCILIRIKGVQYVEIDCKKGKDVLLDFFQKWVKKYKDYFFSLSILKRMNGSILLNRKRNETEETHSNTSQNKAK